MKVGDSLDLLIDDIDSGGKGIAHLDGYTIFVPFAITGEKITAKVNYIKRNLAFATMTHIIAPSEDRVKPVCPIYYRCGGCDIMHLGYRAQLESKRNNLINILRKNSGYTADVAPAIGSENPFFYRNKIQLPFGRVSGKTVLGFYRSGTHTLVPLSKCYLHGNWADKLIKIVSDFADTHKLSVYDETTQKGLLRHLVARYIGGSLVVALVINGRVLNCANALANALQKKFKDVSLYLSINTKRTNVIMGDALIPIHAPPQTVNIDGIKVGVNPLSFFQVNDEIRSKIYNAVDAKIMPDQDSIIIDAYSGIGLLGAIMAKSGAQIYNIEIVPEAIKDADRLYADNGLSATNICGDAADVLPKLIPKLSTQGNLSVILDPPRKGCAPAVLDALVANPVDKLIYISCNPATLSRDLAHLLPTYNINSITPYDMFPQTQHLETLVYLVKK